MISFRANVGTVTGSFVLTLLSAAYVATPAVAQSFVLSPDSKIWVDGTSNKSDWTVVAEEIAGKGTRDASGLIDTLAIKVSAEKMVSEKSSIMDRLMYKTLKASEYPEITFELASVSAFEKEQAEATGTLTIAGVTNEVSVQVGRGAIEGGGERYTGSYSLKMTDYGMTPPSALFGALHTGDDVTVHFEVGFEPVVSGS